MTLALSVAKEALQFDEMPIGAVVVKDGQVIGKGFNRTFTDGDPSAHAEIVAIREAAKTLGDWRLTDCEIYVTLEPCIMCTGAILLSRIKRIYFASYDPKDGACGSRMNLAVHGAFGYRAEVVKTDGGDEASELIREFFMKKRGKQ